jgi:hypothetical protein
MNDIEIMFVLHAGAACIPTANKQTHCATPSCDKHLQLGVPSYSLVYHPTAWCTILQLGVRRRQSPNTGSAPVGQNLRHCHRGLEAHAYAMRVCAAAARWTEYCFAVGASMNGLQGQGTSSCQALGA